MTTETVDQLMLLLNRAAEQDDKDAAADLLIEIFKEAKQGGEVAASPWVKLQGMAKATLEGLLKNQGLSTIKTSQGMAYWPADGETISYDATALDVLCKDDPELAARLAPYRSAKPKKGAFTIR